MWMECVIPVILAVYRDSLFLESALGKVSISDEESAHSP